MWTFKPPPSSSSSLLTSQTTLIYSEAITPYNPFLKFKFIPKLEPYILLPLELFGSQLLELFLV